MFFHALSLALSMCWICLVRSKEVIVLDDWRFNKAISPFETQRRWHDGSPVRVQRPQNQTGVAGHVVHEGSAPIFATTKLADMDRLAKLSEVDPGTGPPQDAEASMIYRRLKVYKFLVILYWNAELVDSLRLFSSIRVMIEVIQ